MNFPHQFFQMNFHSIPVLLAAFSTLGFGLTLRIKQPDNPVTKHFLVLTSGIFVWLFCTAIGYLSKSPDRALTWFRLDNAGVMFISPSFFAFSFRLTKANGRQWIRTGYVLASTLAICSVLGWFPAISVTHYWWGFFPRWSIVTSLPFFTFFFGFMMGAFLLLKGGLLRSASEREKNQVRYVLTAFGIAYLGSVDYLPTFGYAVYPFGFIPIYGLVTLLFYAVVKHRLMDISIIIRQTLTYSLVMASLSIVYLTTVTIFAKLFEGVTGTQTVFSSALSAGLITLGFQPLRRRIQTFVDGRFFRQYVDREEKLYELSREVVTHTTPEAMSEALMRVLNDTLHPKLGALYLRSKHGGSFSKFGSSSKQLPSILEEDSQLVRYFKDHPQPFLQDVPDNVGESYNTRQRQLRSKDL